VGIGRSDIAIETPAPKDLTDIRFVFGWMVLARALKPRHVLEEEGLINREPTPAVGTQLQ
jgi:hypothetical protein